MIGTTSAAMSLSPLRRCRVCLRAFRSDYKEGGAAGFGFSALPGFPFSAF